MKTSSGPSVQTKTLGAAHSVKLLHFNPALTKSTHTTTASMAPKKKVERTAQENISLGPQVREGLPITTTALQRKGPQTNLQYQRRTRLRRRTHLRLLQRHLRPCHRSLVRLNNSNTYTCRRYAWQNGSQANLGDSSGRETISRVTGGMKVKADRDESSPYAAMLAAQDVAARCKELGITALHVKIRATGGMLELRSVYG